MGPRDFCETLEIGPPFSINWCILRPLFLMALQALSCLMCQGISAHCHLGHVRAHDSQLWDKGDMQGSSASMKFCISCVACVARWLTVNFFPAEVGDAHGETGKG